jgi:Domain of unknown function (DUF6457)
VDDWLARARDTLVAAGDAQPEALELSESDAETLLDLARIAAHVSGERTNAPLLCYLVGRAQGNRSLDQLAEALRRSTS